MTEVKPQDAACIIEADVNVDFDAPVGYKEPERVPYVPPKPVLPEVRRILLRCSPNNLCVQTHSYPFSPPAHPPARPSARAC